MDVAGEIAAWSPTAIRSGMTFVQQVRGLGWKEAGRGCPPRSATDVVRK